MSKNYSAIARQYAEDVVSGKQIACQIVKQACQRQLDDLARWDGSPDAPYYFDETAANRVCTFIELMPHVKGEWARRRETLKLQPWQIFIWTTVFGWLRTEDGLRRFREVYAEIPRKNGKSAQVAPVGLYMFTADGEEGSEVYSGATTEKQAWEVYGPAKLMAQRADGFAGHYDVDVRAKNMNILGSASKFEPLIGDPGDGASPHCAIVDEYHEHDSPKLYDTMITGMGARSQPLMIVITTAGYNLGGPCYDMRLRVGKVLSGVQHDEELFGIVYTVDADTPWDSDEALRMANPNYDVSVRGDYLRSQLNKAKQNPSKQNAFKTKHLNIWCNAKSAWMNMQHWERQKDDTLTREALSGEPCWMALDLAAKLDLNAKAMIYRKDGKYYLFCDFFLPEEALDVAQNADIYRGWATEGWITLTDGGMVDFDAIEEDVRESARLYNPDKIGYDPYQASQMVGHLSDEGLPMIEIGATVKNFSDPMKMLEALVSDGKLFHDGNPVLTWCMSNVVCHIDAKDNIFPRKDRNDYKIDGAVASIMALALALAVPEESGVITEAFVRL